MSSAPINNPTAFLSHTAADNAVILTLFAALTARGIECKLDVRTFDGGSSQLENIYDHGIKVADAIVVVISKDSVNAPWVREEVDYATLQRVNRGAKVIPFVIDDVAPDKVYEPLQMRHWVFLKDYLSIEDAAVHIADIIHGKVKPIEVGPRPAWVRIPVYGNVFSLKAQTEVFLLGLCTTVLDNPEQFGRLTLYDYKQVAAEHDIAESSLPAMLHALEHQHFLVEGTPVLGDGGLPPYLKVRESTVLRYLQGYEPSRYHRIKCRLLADIVNRSAAHMGALSPELQHDVGRVLCILGELDSQHHIKLLAPHGTMARWMSHPTVSEVLETLDC